MIQRKQTIYLLIASLISALLFLDWHTGIVYKADIPGGLGLNVEYLKVTNHFPTLLIAVVMTVMPFIAIFLFGNRKRQRMFSIIGLLACISFIAVNLMRIENFKTNSTPPPVDGSYDAGSVIPAVVIVFITLAMSGFRKD